MNLYFFRFFQYLRHWLYSVDEHSLHSPFAFDLYVNTIKNGEQVSENPGVEELRTKLLKDRSVIDAIDFGAGSTVNTGKTKTVRQIALHELSDQKFSQFLHRIIQQRNINSVIELGTSLGLTTLSMAQSNPEARIITFEGNPEIAEKARENLKDHQNVTLVEGNISETLPEVLKSVETFDLAYIDANHTYEATIQYFNWLSDKANPESIVIIDDIYWSPGMKAAWDEVSSNSRVMLSIDLYEAGLVFFSSGSAKSHYRFLF